ncbi:helix-turn-helix transcriptional regulator [Hydrogenobacter thermophilus]|uniref:helix-turn-helix domain-containing protein n=1 Tax=Hydrogenobacter thermophilus TaxID=940 RepID=UPI0030FA6E28
MRFGEYLEKLMQKKKVTQMKLAEMVDISQPTVNMFLSGGRLPAFETLVRIADALHLTMKERKKLFKLRLIIDTNNPAWDEKIIDFLPSVKVDEEEAKRIVQSVKNWAKACKKADTETSFAVKVKKFVMSGGKEGKFDLSSHKSRIGRVISALDIPLEDKAKLALFIFSRLLPEEYLKTLTASDHEKNALHAQ